MLDGFNGSWWAAIILAIPLAIIANLLSKAFERFMDRSRTASSASRIRHLQRRIAKAEFLIAKYGSEAEYLVYVILQTTLVSSLSAVVTALLSVMGQAIFAVPNLSIFHTGNFDFGEVLLASSGAVAALGAVVVVNFIAAAFSRYSDMKSLVMLKVQMQHLQAE